MIKSARNVVLYVGIVGSFAAVIWLLVVLGNQLPLPEGQTSLLGSAWGETLSVTAVTESIGAHFGHQFSHPLSILLLQIIFILALARAFGMVAAKFGQQAVIGEIIAGIFLGPSVLGWFWPDLTAFVFPEASFPALQAISQFGLIFFMFIIGTELDLRQLKNNSRDAVVISHISIVFPFFLGVLLAYGIYETQAPKQVSFLSFALFLGIALSITAFPVLARIIRERGLTESPMGVLAITCAATDDITAWCMLAAIIAIVKAGSIAGALVTVGLAIGYVLLMLYVVRRLLDNWLALYLTHNKDPRIVVSGALLLLLCSAYTAEIIGIHALFGAFTAGVIMSEQTELKEALREKLEDISLLVLLPVFFAYTGLRTQIGLLNSYSLWILCGTITFLAILGKFGGSTLAAKLVGRSWQESLSIGALMNTRGLMELIVLNIGYDLGILSPEIFAMLVIMALATTFMTGPLLGGFKWYFRR